MHLPQKVKQREAAEHKEQRYGHRHTRPEAIDDFGSDGHGDHGADSIGADGHS